MNDQDLVNFTLLRLYLTRLGKNVPYPRSGVTLGLTLKNFPAFCSAHHHKAKVTNTPCLQVNKHSISHKSFIAPSNN